MTEQEFRTYQEQTFDAYCKRLIRNEGVDALKELARRAKREVNFSAMPCAELSALACEDTYQLEEVVLRVKKSKVTINNIVLGQAISSLPPQLREVILLSYFLDSNDVWIGRAFNVTPKAIRYRRQKALDRLREILEVLGYEY